MSDNFSLTTNQLFNDIYHKLVVHHQFNDVYIIDKKYIRSTNLKAIKELLRSENIEFEVTDTQLICKLDEKHKAIAQKVYTPETVKKLEQEQRMIDFKFWNS